MPMLSSDVTPLVLGSFPSRASARVRAPTAGPHTPMTHCSPHSTPPSADSNRMLEAVLSRPTHTCLSPIPPNAALLLPTSPHCAHFLFPVPAPRRLGLRSLRQRSPHQPHFLTLRSPECSLPSSHYPPKAAFSLPATPALPCFSSADSNRGTRGGALPFTRTRDTIGDGAGCATRDDTARCSQRAGGDCLRPFSRSRCPRSHLHQLRCCGRVVAREL
jgi:hypothetical protein